MDLTFYLYIGAFISTISSTSGGCVVESRENCKYALAVCVGTTSESEYNCGPNTDTTFIMRNSSVDTLTFHFFPQSFRIGVRDIEAIDNNWPKIESAAFQLYSKCLNIKLAKNNIKNIKNHAFRYLTVLESINLSMNAIERLNPSSLLVEERSGGKIEKLDLSNNLLTEISSEPFAYLSNLKFLYLQNNRLTTLADDCFVYLKKLTTLDLSNNRLTAINVTLVNLKALQELDLSFNLLKKIAVFEINTAEALLLVNMSYNYIEEVESNCFNRAIYLKELDLSNNRIKTPIDNLIFSNNHHLQRLNLYNNCIEYINDDAFYHSSAPVIILDISHNNVSNVDFLRYFSMRLEELYLNHNKIISIKKFTFAFQIHLKKLDLSMNFIVTIEQISLPLLNLQYLNLTGNRITGVVKNNTFTPSEYLRFLDLNGFNLIRIEDEALINSPLLARVNLSKNAIEYIGPNNFRNMDNLYSLDLSYNKLRELKMNNSNLYNLKALYLNNNHLKNISSSFVNISQLIYLDLSNNDIAEISDPIFKTFGKLQVLRLAGNNIKYFNNPLTNSLTQLLTLSLSSNALTNLNLSYFPDLVDVDLSNISINFINSSLFQNMDHLQSLNLSNNQISELPPGTFQNLISLKLLNLSSNSIKKLRYGSFKDLNRTEVIDLSRNGINDLDVDIFHVCVELKRLIVDYNLITQVDFNGLVKTVSNLNVLSLGGNPIMCNEIVQIFEYAKEFGRHVEVTSIDKIFDEDNVHGILCGRPAATTPNGLEQESSTELPLIWCMVLTIAVFIVGAGSYIYKRCMLAKRCVNGSFELSKSGFLSQ